MVPESFIDKVSLKFRARYLLQMSQAFHRFQMKMKTKMAILDQEMSESVAGEFTDTRCSTVAGLSKIFL